MRGATAVGVSTYRKWHSYPCNPGEEVVLMRCRQWHPLRSRDEARHHRTLLGPRSRPVSVLLASGYTQPEEAEEHLEQLEAQASLLIWFGYYSLNSTIKTYDPMLLLVRTLILNRSFSCVLFFICICFPAVEFCNIFLKARNVFGNLWSCLSN